jgi:hypothetical protein
VNIAGEIRDGKELRKEPINPEKFTRNVMNAADIEKYWENRNAKSKSQKRNWKKDM